MIDKEERKKKGNELLDWAKNQLGLKTDMALAKAMGIHQPSISSMRIGTRLIGIKTVLKIQALTGGDIEDLRKMAGVEL